MIRGYTLGTSLSNARTKVLTKFEPADGVFADAAEVKGAVVFDDVGDLGVAVGRAVLKVFDDFAL